MRSKLLNADPPITYAVVLDTGDEVIGELGKLVREQEAARLAFLRNVKLDAVVFIVFSY